MEHWHTNNSAPYHAEGAHSARILTSSSGNAQAFALDSKEGIENQNPFTSGRFSTKQESKTELHFPVPKLKLGSNDQYAENSLRLQARRQHNREKIFRQRRSNPERPYLQHLKYLQYRARPRCDIGADGKPVWDDQVEEAFQNALVNIEPMGRRKKSQRGRPHGRNELISEWIEQETGEKRTRKQVSSHIQVLNTLLKGIPECKIFLLAANIFSDLKGDALITASENIGSDRPGHEYYSDSIAQMVRSQNSGGNAHYHRSETAALRPDRLGALGGFVDKHHLSRLGFEMWVSLPNQMDQALHIYSRLQSSNPTSIPTPLEDIKNWRMSFPSLRPIVDSWSKSNACDIILLEASFRLMSDFPPKFSKLGISLELDFSHRSNNNGGLLTALDDWSCKTHMFQHGRLVKEVAHDDCHVAGIGKVKPFFESKWWASTFTQLTEKRKMAEDSKNDATIELANESSRDFFRGLTVMQEISAGSLKGCHAKGIWTDQPPREKRMAILLWKFSQAPNGYVGTTTWHKVIAHLEGITSNSPPSTDIALPSLTVNNVISAPHGDNFFDSNTSFMTNSDQQQYNLFSYNPDDSLYHDSFMDYKSNSMADFGDATFDLQTSHMPLDHDMNMSFDMPAHGLTELEEQASHTTTNLFELPQVKIGAAGHRDSIHTISQHESFNDNDSQPPYQPLAKFDMNTHKMLQAQLGNDDDDPFYAAPQDHTGPAEETHPTPQDQSTSASQPLTQPHLDEDDQVLRAALLAASAMSDLGNHPPTHNANIFPQPSSSASQPDPLYIPTSNPFTSPSTLTIRPLLQTHHSFAGIGTDHHHHSHVQNHDHNHGLNHTSGFHTHTHTHSHSRNSSKNDFASVLANLQAYTANSDISFPFDFGNGELDESMHLNLGLDVDMSGNLGIGMGISRPMSQPIISGAGGEEAMGDEMPGYSPASFHEGQTRGRSERVEEEGEMGDLELEHGLEGDEVEGFVVVKTEDIEKAMGVGEVIVGSDMHG